jgi:hypothetical protein
MEKSLEIAPTKDSSNRYYTGNENQPYYLVDDNLEAKEYTYKIKAIDNAGNSIETNNVPINTTETTKIEADVISNLEALPSSLSTKTETSAIISWKTTYPASSQVEYGETVNYGQTTEIDNNLNQGHSILLKNLKPATIYHIRVKSKDIYGRELTSEDATFLTKSSPDEVSILKLMLTTTYLSKD